MRAGESRIVEVPFEASPRPAVLWNSLIAHAKTRSSVTDNAKSRIHYETVPGLTCLTMAKVERTDSGKFFIVIENNLGKIEKTIELLVVGR